MEDSGTDAPKIENGDRDIESRGGSKKVSFEEQRGNDGAQHNRFDAILSATEEESAPGTQSS